MNRPDAPGEELEVGESSPIAATALRWTTWVVVALTVAGLVLPGDLGTVVAAVVVGILVAVPMVRVLWLGARWSRRGDTRYAVAAMALVATVLAGALVTAVLS